MWIKLFLREQKSILNIVSINKGAPSSYLNQIQIQEGMWKLPSNEMWLLTLVEFIFISDVFLNTLLMALTSAKSPARVDVAWAFI